MIEKGSKVKVHYTGKLDDNEVFDSSKDKEPLEFTVGEGLNTGDKKTIELEPSEAYGPVREDLINEVPKENLPEGVEIGTSLQAQTDQGPVMVRVVELNETMGKVDANHPLAGKKLIFDLEVVEVG